MGRSWRLGLAGLSSIAVAYGFARYGYGLFLPAIRREFGLSVAVLGIISSIAYTSYLIALSAVGVMASRVGPRLLVVCGGLSAGTGMTLIALSPNVTVLIVGVALAGASSGWAWAPYSDAVARTVPEHQSRRILSVISTGTAFGIIVAGPVALIFMGLAWRWAWLIFAAIAFVISIWNAVLLPAGPHGNEGGTSLRQLGLGWFVRAESLPLFGAAFTYGLVGSVYWTFAVDAIARSSENGSARAPAFWTVIGLTGVAGMLTGDAIARFGLGRVLPAILATLGVAIGLLGAAPGHSTAILSSAMLYGPSFMAMAALLAVWSSDVFPDQPSTGFSATVLLLGVGAIVGPGTLGYFASEFGLRSALLVTAALSLLGALIRPHQRHRGPSAANIVLSDKRAE